MKNPISKLIHLVVLYIVTICTIQAQIAPGSTLTDATDEAFLQSCFGGTTMNGTLLFSTDIHGYNIPTFHLLCDNQGPTIVLYHDSIHNQVFGGYMDNPWTSTPGYYTSSEAFLFNLTHDFKLDIITFQHAQYSSSSYFPTFGGGHDIYAGSTTNPNINYTNPFSYQSPNLYGQSFLNGGSAYNDAGFSKIEVFAVTPANYAGGAGTLADPYQIDNKLNLKYLSEHPSDWSSYFIQTADLHFNSNDFALGGDFYNLGEGFSPIGNSSVNFQGDYNGNFHTIDSLFIDRSGSNDIGLFGLTGTNAFIYNLGVTNCNVSGAQYTGGLIGYLNGQARGCYTTGSVNGGIFTGGFAGRNNGFIDNCYSRCMVTGSDIGGGFVSGNTGTITDCYATGSVSGGTDIGGFAFYSYGSMSDCFWDTTSSNLSSSANGSIGLSTAEMQEDSTFTNAGWDYINENTNGINDFWKQENICGVTGYPILAWQNPPTPTCIYTWTGATDADWHDGTNWNTGTVPSASDIVVIPDISATYPLHFPATTSTITVGKLTVNNNAILYINEGLVLTDTLDNNGTVRLNDEAFLDDYTNPNAYFDGDIRVVKLVNYGSGLGQRMFGSPVHNGIVQGLNQTYASASSGYIVMSNCASGQADVGSPYNNIFRWDEHANTPNNCEFEAWYAFPQNNTLENGRGYSGWMQDNTLITFEGIPNTGNITYGGSLGNSNSGLVNKDGWHVLSNPYPSGISPNDLTSNGWQSLQTYDATSGPYAGTFQPLNPTQNISVAQGFVAKTTSANSAVFTNAMRTHSNVSLKNNNDWFEAKLDISVNNGNAQDITYIYFNSNASQAFDPQWDCEKRYSDVGVPTLYSNSTGMNTSLNGNNISELGDYSFPIGLRPESNSSFTFEVNGLNTFPASTIIYLEDKTTGTWTNLRDQNIYTFNMTTQEDENRFEIHFTKPLAVEFEAESCTGNDGNISIDFGNQNIGNQLQIWNYELRIDQQIVASANESDIVLIQDLRPGDYEIKFTNGNLQITESVTIEDKIQVEAYFDLTTLEVFTGDEIEVLNTSTGATDYTWEVNNETFMTPDLNYTFTNAGNYLIKLVSYNNDCDAAFEQTIEVLNKSTGITEQIELEKVVIYTKDNSIIIDLSNVDLKGQTDLQVYDLLGKLIMQKLDIKTLEQIEMANHSRGYYFVNIINQEEQVSKKVIIK